MANKEIYHIDLTTGKTSVKHSKVSKGSKGKRVEKRNQQEYQDQVADQVAKVNLKIG